MPATVVQRARQLLQQATALVGVGAAAFACDALLQHLAHHAAVLGRPQVGAGVQQAVARGLQADGCALSTFRQGLPLQAKAHAGGGRAFFQLIVDALDLALGVTQQLLHGTGDLGLQVVLQHLALADREQLAALRDLACQARA